MKFKLLSLIVVAMSLSGCMGERSDETSGISLISPDLDKEENSEENKEENQAENQEENPDQKMLSKYILKNRDQIIRDIDDQLVGIDQEALKIKEQLILEKNIIQLQELVQNKELTYEEITAIYLMRIKKYDQNEKGLNSVISINKNAINEAKKCDEQKLNTSYLYGIPVMFKDNINTKELPTTAGTVALKNFLPKENSELVNKILNSGAVFLGKNSLSEFANSMSTNNASGFSNFNGQTKNPYGPEKYSPSGSSSGSAVSVTSNFVPISIGTETAGSIISPSSINAVVGFRPSKGAISTEGIIPLSSTLDMPGPISKSVLDSIIAYNEMAINEKLDLAALDSDYIKDKKFVVVKIDSDAEEQTNKLVDELQKIGAQVELKVLNFDAMNVWAVLMHEYAKDLGEYLEKYDAPYKSMSDIIKFNNEDLQNRAMFGQNLLEQADGYYNSPEYAKEMDIESMINEAKKILEQELSDDNIALVYPAGNYSALVSMSESPQITIPWIIDEAEGPIGATFCTLPGNDIDLLNIAYSFEQNTKYRVQPKLD